MCTRLDLLAIGVEKKISNILQKEIQDPNFHAIKPKGERFTIIIAGVGSSYLAVLTK